MENITGVIQDTSPVSAPVTVEGQGAPTAPAPVQQDVPSQGVSQEASPASTPAEGQQEQRTVPLEALLKERRHYKEQIDWLVKNMGMMQQQQAPQPQPVQPPYQPYPQSAPPQTHPQIGDDEFLTGQQFKAYLNTLDERAKQQEMQYQQSLSQTRQAISYWSEERAKQRYSDFNEVINYTMDMVRNSPNPQAMLDKIYYSNDPAETAYRFGQMHDAYRGKLEQNLAQDLVGKIQANAQQPKTLSSVPGTPAKPITQMSDAEIMAEINRMKGYA